MPDPKPIEPISLARAFAGLRFLADREPSTSGAAAADAFAELARYRDGAIFVGHYAGASEWERHAQGDEIVYAVEGETTLILLTAQGERPSRLRAGDIFVVSRNTWHRFETPQGVKILTVTPQPTDHSIERPRLD